MSVKCITGLWDSQVLAGLSKTASDCIRMKAVGFSFPFQMAYTLPLKSENYYTSPFITNISHKDESVTLHCVALQRDSAQKRHFCD